MRTSFAVGGYAIGLIAIFAAALGIGNAVGPDITPAPSDHEQSAGAPVGVPGGLQVAADGYRLAATDTQLTAAQSTSFAFQVIGPDGAAVTSYTPTHDKDLHLIVVRRDLTGFQHVHPRMAADGTWLVPLTLGTAGQYRAFADFQPAGRDEPLTLGVDLAVAGQYDPRPRPAPVRTATVDDYTVTLAGDLVPGTSSKLTLTVLKAGAPVTDLQPYLAAYGHLVALRDGDLAYLHVHPDGTPGDGRTKAGPDITFYAQVPSVGTYGLFLDFQHDNQVRTAAFSLLASPTNTPVTPASQDSGHSHS